MEARQSDVGVSLGTIGATVTELPPTALQGDSPAEGWADAFGPARSHFPLLEEGEGPSPTPRAKEDIVSDSAAGEGEGGDPAPVLRPYQPTPKWSVVALLGGIALSGAWVGLLVWLVGRWIGAV